MTNLELINPVRSLRGNNAAVKVQLNFYCHRLTMKSSTITGKCSKDGKLLTGFTIIELVISVFILSAAVVGVFGAFSVVTILASDSSDRLTATYLAQEGTEIVRNIRDTNWLNIDVCTFGSLIVPDFNCPATWVDGLTIIEGMNSSIDCTTGCEADYKTMGTASSPLVASPPNGNYLKVDSSVPEGNGFYNYSDDGVQTKFKRKIIITPIIDVGGSNDSFSSHIIKVVVQVSWDEKASILYSGRLAGDCGATNCVTAEAILYDWY